MKSLAKTYREIWYKSQKPGGERNFFDYFFYRRISTLLLCLIRDMDVSPDTITSISVLCSLLAGILFVIHEPAWLYYLAIVFMMLSLVTDTMDGQYARLKDKSSEFGAWYDTISDSLKYVILFISLSIGAYLNNSIDEQWLLNDCQLFRKHPGIILFGGLLIVSNFYMVYQIHNTRYHLSFNPGTMVNFSTSRSGYHFGIESTLYTLFLIFLLFNQVYWLFIFLICTLPFAWIFPLYRTWRQSTESGSNN